MNIPVELLEKLVTGQGDLESVLSVEEVFGDFDKERAALEYIKKYHGRTGKLPDLETFRQNVPEATLHFSPVEHDFAELLFEAGEQVARTKLYAAMGAAADKASPDDPEKRPDITGANEIVKRYAETLSTPEQSSWQPWNPDDWHENGRTELETLCLVDGDLGLFYRGKTNTVIAESEAGKSWLGLRACADEINQGHHANFVDCEDGPDEVYERLMYMCDWPDIRKYFSYFCPEGPMPGDFISKHVEGRELVVIDGYGEALALHGLKSDDEGILRFNRMVSRPMSLTGASVLLLDHFPKDTGNQANAFGSVYKKNTVSGASYALRNKTAFGKKQKGYSVLEVFKDRPGQIRQECEQDGKKFYAAELHVDSTGEGTTVKLKVPTLSHFTNKIDYKQRVSDFMQKEQRATMTAIKTGVTGNNTEVWAAAKNLVFKGFLREDGTSVVFVKPWRAEYA